MTQISASLVRDLRETTGAGMMDCKKALDENKGDMDAAIDWLRKKGLAAAAKKSGRVAAEGLVAAIAKDKEGVLLELNSETDFVARNEHFQQFASDVVLHALTHQGILGKIRESLFPSGKTVDEELTLLIAKIGEHMNLRRSAHLSVEEGVVVSYVHSALAPGLGKIGVLVALKSSGDKHKLQALGKQLAMHVAAANPQALTINQVSAEMLERERAVLTEQAAGSGKPADIIAKMVDGRIRKYYEEVVLLEQLYVIDGETKISQVLANAAKDVGAPVEITGFIRYALGEGIEKEQGDFAAEVAAQLDR
jgi:elongation factor Ts